MDLAPLELNSDMISKIHVVHGFVIRKMNMPSNRLLVNAFSLLPKEEEGN